MWEVSLHPAVETWFLQLCEADPSSADLVSEAIELRPPSSGGTEIRVIFAFDPSREAILLVGGDKAGAWQSWYQSAIPLADDRFTEHLTRLKEEQP